MPFSVVGFKIYHNAAETSKTLSVPMLSGIRRLVVHEHGAILIREPYASDEIIFEDGHQEERIWYDNDEVAWKKQHERLGDRLVMLFNE